MNSPPSLVWYSCSANSPRCSLHSQNRQLAIGKRKNRTGFRTGRRLLRHATRNQGHREKKARQSSAALTLGASGVDANVEDHRLVDLTVEARARVCVGHVVAAVVVRGRIHAGAASASADLEGEIVLAEPAAGSNNAVTASSVRQRRMRSSAVSGHSSRSFLNRRERTKAAMALSKSCPPRSTSPSVASTLQ